MTSLEVAREAASKLAPDLAAKINSEHQAATAAFSTGFSHAMEAGRLLLQAKARNATSNGAWLAWLDVNVTFSRRLAQVYMRLAREVPKLSPERAQRVAHLSLREAVREIADSTSRINKLPPPVIDRVFSFNDREMPMMAKRAENEMKYRQDVAKARAAAETPRNILQEEFGPLTGRKWLALAVKLKRRYPKGGAFGSGEAGALEVDRDFVRLMKDNRIPVAELLALETIAKPALTVVDGGRP